MSELLRAVNANDVNGVIDAMCDMVVFTANLDLINDNDLDVMNVLKYNLENNGNILKITENIINKSCHMIKVGVDISLNGINKEEIDDLKYSLMTFVITCFSVIEHLGYNHVKCMDETIKEINSRTGRWNDEIKKFVKDEKVSPYVADYASCLK